MSSPDRDPERDVPEDEEEAPEGLINAAPDEDAEPDAPAGRPDVKAIVEAIEAEMAPESRQDYNRIVVSGMKYGLNKGVDGIMGQLPQARDPVRNCAVGAVNTVFQKLAAVSNGNLPQVAGVFASKTLMYLALDFAEKAGIIELTAENVARAESLWSNAIMTAFRISPDKLKRGAEQVHGVLVDQSKMDQLALMVGARKDPRASVPMEMSAPAPAPAEPAESPKMNRRQRRAAARAGRG